MNLANKITLVRVFMIPVYLFVYMAKPFGLTPSLWAALIIFSAAAITDAIDGHIARRYKQESNFGRLMDPLADKLLVCAALVAFVASGSLPAWAVIILISREFYISGLRQLALTSGKVLAASSSAKFKTITQITLVIYVLIPIQIFRFDWLVMIVLIVTVAASIFSAVEYTVKNKNVVGLKE